MSNWTAPSIWLVVSCLLLAGGCDQVQHSLPHVCFLDHSVYFESYLPTLIFGFSRSSGSERNSTLKLEAQPFFQACKCVYVRLQNYHQGEKIIRPDGITLIETARRHMLENRFQSKCTGSILFSKAVELLFEPFILLNSTFTGIFEIIALPKKSPLECCVCEPWCVFVLCVHHCVFWHGQSQQEGSGAGAAFILCSTLTTFLLYDNSET